MTRALALAGIALLRFVLLGACLASGIAGGAAPSLARQEEPSGPVEIGAGPVRERSLALVGRSLYGADSVQMTGYLSAATGLDADQLFTDGTPTPQTARFTYAGEAALSDSASRGDVTAFSGDGTVRIYVDDDGGAAWDDPASFANGELVAEFSLVLRSTVQRQAPGVGVVVADDQLLQVSAEEFALGDGRYRFGQQGLAWRLRSVGALTGDAAETQSSALAVSLTGSASIVDRETVPVVMGAAPAP